MKYMDREFEKLKKKTLSLAGYVEECVQMAVKAIDKKDKKLAEEVLIRGVEVDHMEVDLEEDCLKILALYQPVAIDLRFVVSVFKINNDLERISDLADNIAERAIFLASRDIQIPFDFGGMTEKTVTMLNQSLNALVNLDQAMAYQVCAMDDEVDAINRDMYKQIKKAIEADPAKTEALLHVLGISRHLERIADHATNIAEDVIYMVDGVIIRHKTEDYCKIQDKSLMKP